MTENTFHVALTGHRPNKLDGYKLNTPFYRALTSWLVHIVETGLTKHPHLTLHSGLALGADTVWSHVILAMREQYPDRITFVAEVPVMTQSSQWPSTVDKNFWQKQIDSADLVNVYAGSYTPAAMTLRNEGMIGAAQLVLAVWDGSTGGTGHAVRFAERSNIQVFRMTPEQIRMRAIEEQKLSRQGLWDSHPVAAPVAAPAAVLPPNVRIGQGDLLASNADVLVNTVNTVGVMGKGIALQFKGKYPDMFELYRLACERGNIKIGQMFVVPVEGPNGRRWVVNFPTKRHWREPSRLQDVADGLVDFVRVLRELDIKSVALPALGAGNGGLDWAIVKPLILTALKEIPEVAVELYEPVAR